MTRIAPAAALFAAMSATMAFGQGLPSPEGAAVYFINVEDGATVSSPLTIQFGLSGMGIAPAGHEQENTGHHHLLIDRAAIGEGDDGADELLYSMPANDNLKHFGGGQTEVTLELAPGEHTFQLVLGDWTHTPHDPPVTSDVITVTVE